MNTIRNEFGMSHAGKFLGDGEIFKRLQFPRYYQMLPEHFLLALIIYKSVFISIFEVIFLSFL